MQLPDVDANDICLHPDSSVESGCSLIDGEQTRPYPASPPPQADVRHLQGSAQFTFHLSAGTQKSQTEKFAPEYFLNGKPWQLFRSAMEPLLFADLSKSDAQSALEKPIIHDLPIGSVVDLIIENQLNDTIPLYKHGKPAWLLGSRAYGKFPHGSVRDAVGNGEDSPTFLNLRDPPLVVVHDLPPLGWSVLRFHVTTKAAILLHAVKLRYFVVSHSQNESNLLANTNATFQLGMAVPILEGITVDDPLTIPTSAVNRPHVKFDPKNDGIFG